MLSSLAACVGFLVQTDGLGCIWYLLLGLRKDSVATSGLGSPSPSHGSSPSSVSSTTSHLADASDPAPWGQSSCSEFSAVAPGYKLGSPARCPPPLVPLAESRAPADTHCPVQSSCAEPQLLGRTGSCASVRGDAQVPRGCREPDVGPQTGLAWPQEHGGGGRGHAPSPSHAGTASAPSGGAPTLPSTPCPTPALRIGLGSATENVKGQILS